MLKVGLFAISIVLALPATAVHSKQTQDPSKFVSRFASISGDQFLVNVIRKEDNIWIASEESQIEEIFQKLSNSIDSSIHFHCIDPTELRDRRSLTITETSIAGSIEAILQEFKFAENAEVVTSNDQPIGAGGAGVSVRIYPASCQRESEPERTFVPMARHPVLRQPPEQIELAELEEILRSEGPESRRRAAQFLMLSEDRRVLFVAAEASADPNATVMLVGLRALMILGKRFDAAIAADVVYRRLQERPYFESLRMLAKLDKEKTWHVIQALMASGAQSTRSEVVSALNLTRDVRGLGWLEQVAFAEDEGLAEQAILTIGLIGGLEAESALRNVLAKGKGAQKAVAAKAIYLLPNGERSRAERDLVILIRREDVPPQVFKAMIDISYLKPIADILRSAQSDAKLKERVLRHAGINGSENTIETIALALNDEAPEVRVAAVGAMDAIVAESALPYLLRMMNDNDARVRAAAAKGLGRFWTEEPIVSALAKGLHDGDENVRKASIEAFGELGKPDDEVENVLRGAVQNEDLYVSEMANSLLEYWRLN